MKLLGHLLFLLMIPAVLCTGALPAYALRCGTNLVDVGDTKIDVLRKCGKPDLVDEWDEDEYFRRSPEIDHLGEAKKRAVRVTVEQWTYNFGSTRLIYYLIFRNGTLTEVNTGNYGF